METTSVKRKSKKPEVRVSALVFERLKRRSVDLNGGMRDAVRSVINNKPGTLKRRQRQKTCTITLYKEDYDKLTKMKTGTSETYSSLLEKLMDNGEDIDYVDRWS